MSVLRIAAKLPWLTLCRWVDGPMTVMLPKREDNRGTPDTCVRNLNGTDDSAAIRLARILRLSSMLISFEVRLGVWRAT
jgi:hypothetical protein